MKCFLLFTLFAFIACQRTDHGASATEKPNILWITCEDINPMIGVYGDAYATTPNLDAFATKSVRFTHAFATAAVCAPARSCLITGVQATTLGTQHLRSEVNIPDFVTPFPKLLRQAGYYCSNNYKEDYSFSDSTIWDESSNQAHWRNRAPGQPFFSVFNLETTHQSKIFGNDSIFEARFGRLLDDSLAHEPADAPVPPYYPDSPEIRKMWARYYDLVTIMDRQVGEILRQLEEDGLAENTIVFFFSDHGTGMPRAKRALYDTGIKVPLMVHIPLRYRDHFSAEPGSLSGALVSFVDFAPTMLAITDIEQPAYMQGVPFLVNDSPSNEYIYAAADRVDEAFEFSRCVRSADFKYIRNYYPQLPLLQSNYYTDQSEIMRELVRLKNDVPLNEVQQTMWIARRPVEELYYLPDDPFETNNLATDPSYIDTLKRFRQVQLEWMKETRDTGLMPESYMHSKPDDVTVYEATRDSAFFPIERILETNESIMDRDIEALYRDLMHEHPLVRFWAITGLQYYAVDRPDIIRRGTELLRDSASFNRIAAASWLASSGMPKEALPVLVECIESCDGVDQLQAIRAFELLGDHADPIRPRVARVKDALEEQTMGKWYGYDLYAFWSLKQAFNDTLD